jgi:anti-sigma factor RsiW
MDKENTTQEDAELKALAQGLHELYDPVLEEPVPERLRARVARRGRWRVAAIAAGWVALGLCAGVLAGWQLHASRPGAASASSAPEVPGFVKRAAVAHAVYSPEVRHPVEVGADQEAHLVAWLSKRLGTPLRAPHLEDVGYFLVGGRLLPGENGPVAHFMYQCKKGTRVTLYVRSNAPGSQETAFRYSAEGNVKVFYWIDRRLGYALSSADIVTDDLLKVANAVYQQLNP